MVTTRVVPRERCVVESPRAVRLTPRAVDSPTAVGKDPLVDLGYVEAAGWCYPNPRMSLPWLRKLAHAIYSISALKIENLIEKKRLILIYLLKTLIVGTR